MLNLPLACNDKTVDPKPFECTVGEAVDPTDVVSKVTLKIEGLLDATP